MSFVVIMELSNAKAVEGYSSRRKDNTNGKGRASVIDEGLPLPDDFAC